jgi:hypothetical protein
MRLARRADEATKSADAGLFVSATDPQGNAVSGAVKQAKQDVADAAGPIGTPKSPRKPRQRVVLDGLYRLPLLLTGDQKDCLEELRKSANWRGAQMAIIATLDRLFIQCGIVNDLANAERQGSAEPNRPETLPEESHAANDTDLPGIFRENAAVGQEAEHEDAIA